MADLKISELTAVAAPLTATDIIPVVDDLEGTPTTKKVTATNFLLSIQTLGTDGAGNFAVDGNITSGGDIEATGNANITGNINVDGDINPKGQIKDNIYRNEYPLLNPLFFNLTSENTIYNGFSGTIITPDNVYFVPYYGGASYEYHGNLVRQHVDNFIYAIS